MADKIGNEKAAVQQSEILSPTQTNDYDRIDEEKRAAAGLDYSGAHKKTDPKEIALVKKLDWYIMPT